MQVPYVLTMPITALKMNAVHCSDSAESAAREIAYCFTEGEVYPRIH